MSEEQKQLHYFYYHQTFKLESAYSLENLTLAYSTFGKLNLDSSNVVWVCHALTANSDPTEWWPGLIGNSDLINPSEHFIICANIIGSPYGSTHPLSINPETNKAYFSEFPLITIRDMVNAFILLADFLKIKKIELLIGASMGGQQALEWSIIQPDFIKKMILIATNAVHSPYGIAFNESQRLCILADSTFYKNHPSGGKAGLIAARSIALLSYRSYETYQEAQSENELNKVNHFRAASYQDYQGEKLANRFDAYSYFALSKSMDSHNIARGRNSIIESLNKIKAKTLAISIKSDVLFPVHEQELIAKNIKNSHYEIIDSHYGHDGFLLETHQLTDLILKHQMLEKNHLVIN
jgi:homoserine O-acetyltransferase